MTQLPTYHDPFAAATSAGAWRDPVKLALIERFASTYYRTATSRRKRTATRIRPPDGLRTRAEAAAKLRISVKTLDEHVASGALRYVALGHGKTRPRRMFTDADLDEFISNQTRRDFPCLSIARGARRSGNSTSGSGVIAFTGLRRPRPSAKPKK
jgi:hypothetical protein